MRKSASEVLRNLEQRVARLEKQSAYPSIETSLFSVGGGKPMTGDEIVGEYGFLEAGDALETAFMRGRSRGDRRVPEIKLIKKKASESIKSTTVVDIISRDLRIKLPSWEETKDMSIKELMTISTKVGFGLGDNWSWILLRHGEIVLKGIDLLRTDRKSSSFWGGLVCSKTGKFIAADGRFQQSFIRGFKESEYINDYNAGVAEEAANYDVPSTRYLDAEKLAKGIDFTVRGNDLVITLKR